MADVKKIPERTEIRKEDTWAIEDIYATDDAFLADLESFKALTAEMAGYAGKLADPKQLLAYARLGEKAAVMVSNLANYSMRRSDVDTRDAKYQGLVGQFMSAYAAFGAAISFETPEILKISDEKMEEFYKAVPELERFRRYLFNIQRKRAHVLTEAEEKLLASASEMAATPDNIYSLFNNADLQFPDAVDSNGNHLPLSQGTYIDYMTGSDRTLRKSAFDNLYHTYGQYKNAISAMLNGQVKQLRFFAEARKYETSMAASLGATNVPTSVYTNLIEAVHQNMDKMYKYVDLRKKLLHVDELHMYDLYARLVEGVDKQIPIEEAKQTIYNALEPLGEDYRKVLMEGFRSRWIDLYENKGKRSGAYSAGAFVHPYVLMNYTGTLDSEFTLAHEMGHAMHSYHSNKNQTPLNADYVIFVAEVASTCNEALLMEYLLKNTTDKKERAYLLNYFLEQFRTTLYRQTMFAEFEMILGKLEKEGVTLTAEVMCQEYRKLNRLYFGENMVLDDEIDMEWARIPHFYYDYYVFQYATGYAAAIALSRRILKEGSSAVADYIGFLSGGCSKDPIDLLKGAGVDMSTTTPINQALELFGDLIDELSELMED